MTETQPVQDAEVGAPVNPNPDSTSEFGSAQGSGTVPSPERLDELEEAMRDVVDPELGINVVDLGLVYGLFEDDGVVTIDMTLTSAACPLTDVIEDQARGALVRSDLCTDMKINWVWLPPWGPDKITEDGREQLRALGFTV
ncbi:metal-sulfur cluster assembly factor [Rhodococcus erythropolis]|uniref:metal-sulfur cluster assembly factor n=1 Tax=Rhodococcus erythropolis TaxID=1833 RepID=UPI003816024F